MITDRDRKPFDVGEFLTKAREGRTVAEYATDEVIHEQGDTADSVFYVQTGKVKLSVTSEEGREAIVAMLTKDDFFGEGCVNGDPYRLETATALTASIISKIAKAEILKAIHNEPAFAEFFISHLIVRKGQIHSDLVDQLFNSSEKRLARVLLLLANFGKEGEPEPVLPKISQETLAEMVGTTRSRVSFFMNKFRRLGMISYNGRIEVHRSLLNMVLHERPEIES